MNNRTRGKIYSCGWDYPEFRKQLFPDYEFAGEYTRLEPKSPNDILFTGMHGDCIRSRWNIHQNQNQYQDIQETFQGKVLIMNGENFGNILDSHPNGYSRLYQIGGPVDNTDHTMIAYFGIMDLLSRETTSNAIIENQLSWILDPSQKPKWNGNKNNVAFLVSNCLAERKNMVKTISSIVPVDTLGKCTVPNHPNVTSTSVSKEFPELGQSGGYGGNHKVFRQYKYCLVMENRNIAGYITEKILNAFLGGCIPIYSGSKEIFNIFNQKAFLYIDPSDKMSSVFLRRDIGYLEKNATAYEEMQQESILANGEETIRDYFSYRDDLGGGYLKREIRVMMGVEEDGMSDAAAAATTNGYLRGNLTELHS